MPLFPQRAAYHLYPHNVLFDPYFNTIPRVRECDPATSSSSISVAGCNTIPTERLRWEGGAPIPAELIVGEPGAALFRIR